MGYECHIGREESYDFIDTNSVPIASLDLRFLSNLAYRYSITAVSKLLRNLYLCGGSAATVPTMKELGVTLVINATTETELPNTPLPCDDTNYMRVPVKDNRETDLDQYFNQVADRIEEVRSLTLDR